MCRSVDRCSTARTLTRDDVKRHKMRSQKGSRSVTGWIDPCHWDPLGESAVDYRPTCRVINISLGPKPELKPTFRLFCCALVTRFRARFTRITMYGTCTSRRAVYRNSDTADRYHQRAYDLIAFHGRLTIYPRFAMSALRYTRGRS